MLRTFALTAGLTLFVVCVGFAQPAEMENAGTPPPPPPPMPTMDQAPVPVTGDVVLFKNGRELRDVKVIRESPFFVEIEYLPGEPLLQIPRSQVEEVVFGDRGRSRDGADAPHLPPDVMPGEELSAEFHRALMAPLSEEEMVFENADYLTTLREFAGRVGIDLDAGEGLRNLPAEARQFSRIVPPGATLMGFLRKDLAEIAPNVRVILQFDKIVLQLRPSVPEIVEDASAPVTDALPGE